MEEVKTEQPKKFTELPGRNKEQVITGFTWAYTKRYYAKKTVSNASNFVRSVEEETFLRLIHRIGNADNLEEAIKESHNDLATLEDILRDQKKRGVTLTGTKARITITKLFIEIVPPLD